MPHTESQLHRGRRVRALPIRVLLPLLLAAPVGGAEPAAPEARVEPLVTIPVADVSGQELTMETVEYSPGGGSPPHRHDAYVLVYVLEGTLEMQVAGQPLVRLKAGESFVERPNDVHQVSRNASATRPAKFLVVMLKKAGTAQTRKVTAPPS